MVLEAIRRSAKRSFFLTLLILGGGCAGTFSRLHQLDTNLQPNAAERDPIRGFIELEIPLQARNLDGRVRSGRFNPVELWGTRTMERVVCGSPAEADPRLHPHSSEFEIVVTIRTRTQVGTRLDLDAHGWAESSDGERVPCQLTEPFVDEIFAKVGREARW